MRNRPCSLFIALGLFALAALSVQLSPAFAQGMAFTYQGELNAGGEPANGSYDFIFSLYDANNLNNRVAGGYGLAGVGVTNGLFTVVIDFTGYPNAFNAENRWLDIQVRTNGAATYTRVSPLQPLMPAPFAIATSNLLGAVSSASISGTYGNAVTLNNAANNLTGTFTGNGATVSNVNALTLNGLNSGNFWQVAGNTVAPGQFLGSTNNQPVEIRANNLRALRIEPDGTDAPNIIGGSPINFVASGTYGATIGGGGSTYYNFGPQTNSVSGNYGIVEGGYGNTVLSEAGVVGGAQNTAGGSYEATVAGGYGNTANGYDEPTVGGGYGNTASGDYEATVGGGYQNIASGYTGATVGGGVANLANGFYDATVSGGQNNQATNSYATVPGGFINIAGGQYSFAAGQQAQALHQGAFVWADSQNATFASTTSNQFLIRAQGGVGVNTASTPDNDFSINTNTYLFSHILYLRGEGGSDHNHGLAYCGTGETNFAPAVLPDGPVLWGYGGGALATANGQKAILNWNPSGVAINTANPNGASLFVQGNQTGNYLSPVALIQNTNTTSADSPALRVVSNGSATSGALSVSSQNPHLTGLIAQFGNSNAFVVTITNDGTIYAKAFTLTSDRNTKENFTTLDAKKVLARVAALPVTEWNYKDNTAEVRHIGPMAQDFYTAFGLNGGDDQHISVVDETGVALAAIQGLNEKVEGGTRQTEDRIQKLEAENQELKARLDRLEQFINQKNGVAQ